MNRWHCASSGRNERAKVVFPAPFGPAMMMTFLLMSQPADGPRPLIEASWLLCNTFRASLLRGIVIWSWRTAPHAKSADDSSALAASAIKLWASFGAGSLDSRIMVQNLIRHHSVWPFSLPLQAGGPSRPLIRPEEPPACLTYPIGRAPISKPAALTRLRGPRGGPPPDRDLESSRSTPPSALSHNAPHPPSSHLRPGRGAQLIPSSAGGRHNRRPA